MYSAATTSTATTSTALAARGAASQKYSFNISCHFPSITCIIQCSLMNIIRGKPPLHLEPSGMSVSDGKWPGGASIVPWKVDEF